MKDKFEKGGGKVGQFVAGGRKKWIPAHMERQVIPPAPPETVTTKKSWRITINLFEIAKWLAIIWFLVWLSLHVSITVAF